MDNLCHTFAGAVLVKAGLERYTPLAMPTLLIGANLPDIDIVTRLKGQVAYLQYHRGITHSIVGVIGLSLVLAAGVVVFDRMMRRRGSRSREPARFSRLFVVSLIGVGSHPLLDFTNAYGVRPFLPWDDRWVYGDLAFVVDPWLWLILGGTAFMLTSQTRWRLVAWGIFGGLLTLIVVRASIALSLQYREPMPFRWLWVLFLIAPIAARWYGFQRYGSRVAVGALLAVVVYWAGLSVAHHVALTHVRLASQTVIAGQPTSRHAALPRPATPLTWSAVFETPDAIYYGTASIGSAPGREWTLERYPKQLDDPIVRRALDTHAGAVMREFGRYLFAEVDRQADGYSVVLRDARFERSATSGFSVVTIPLDEGQQRGGQ
jgi:inner membrane protein